MNSKDKKRLTKEIHDGAEKFAKSIRLKEKIATMIAESLEKAIIMGVTDTLVAMTEEGINSVTNAKQN